MVAALRGAVGLPWQRVLGAGGAIKLRGDYAFEQRFRLEAEGVTFRGRKVDMKLHEHKFPKARKTIALLGRSVGIPSRAGRSGQPAGGRRYENLTLADFFGGYSLIEFFGLTSRHLSGFHS